MNIEKYDEYILRTASDYVQGVFTYGRGSMKALILISTGAAAALLAFIGHLATSGMKESAKGLALPLCIFMFASLLATAGLGFSYFSQAKSCNTQEHFLLGNIGSKEYRSDLRWAYAWMSIAILCVFLSFAACLTGIGFSYWAFMGL